MVSTEALYYILGGGLAVIFTAIHYSFYVKSRSARRSERRGPDEIATVHDEEEIREIGDENSREIDDDTNDEGEKPDEAEQEKEEEKGPQPPIDFFILGGTISLGVIMWIGTAAIIVVAQIRRSDFRDADLSDFEYLGESTCWIERSHTYQTRSQELNSLNTVCLEEWTYEVRVDKPEGEEMPTTTFISNPQSFRACAFPCDACPPSRLQGPDFYAGVDETRRGQPIITNETLFVPCWAPTKDVSELSDFYPCRPESCFLLEDPQTKLRESTQSYEFTMWGAYAGLASGAVMFMVAAWCLHINRRWRLKQKERTQHEDEVSAESGTPANAGDNVQAEPPDEEGDKTD